MMVQIEKRKKKGRPSKADLQARARAASVVSDLDLRRSSRRRSFRYNIIDYDEDYLDEADELFQEEEEDDDEEEEEERREKKVKLVVKINGFEDKGKTGRNRRGRGGRVGMSRDSDGEDDEGDERVVKKRRINRRPDDDDCEEDDDVDESDEGRDRTKGAKREDYNVPGTPAIKENDDSGDDDDDGDGGGGGGDRMPASTPLPEKKQLEIILDKLQKKDTYGVYAEPVDPDELPDYHEVIEHPMDFSTVRTKLGDGSYSTLEEFESDVYLISSNAVQYNAPDTIYHRQARTIKELAEKKFQRLRNRIELWEHVPKSESKSEPMSEPKDRPSPLSKKLIMKPVCGNALEPVDSDFTSVASLATVDAQNNGYKTDHAGNLERPSSSNGLLEAFSSLADTSVDKSEDHLSGKGILLRFGRRSFVFDENRRATYNISNQPEDRSESIFSTFEDDKKQLIPVGLSGEFSYARSLARFAGNLGPPSWRIASKRIEEVLPPGLEYGPGWIGEYEPLPSSQYVVEHQKNLLVSKPNNVFDAGALNKFSEGQVSASPHLLCLPSSDRKCETVFTSEGINQPPTVSAPQHILFPGASGAPKRVESNCSSPVNKKSSAMFHQQGRFPGSSYCETVGARKLEQNSSSKSDHKRDDIHPREPPHGERRAEPHSFAVTNQRTDNDRQKQPHKEVPPSRPVDSVPMGKNFLQSLPFKHPNSNGGMPAGVANGKMHTNTADSIRVSASPICLQPAKAVVSFPQRQDQGLSDPVQVMKMLAEGAQRQQSGSAHPHNPSVVRSSVPSPRVDAGGNAAAAAASAWMAVGAAGFRPAAHSPAGNQSPRNGTRVFYPKAMPPHVECSVSASMQFQPEKRGLPFQAFASQPIKGNYEAQVHNRPMGFPQLSSSNLSQFQMQAHCRGLSPLTQHKQKQDTLPPDLNVAFPSPTDSQQPDLALQL